MEKILITGNGFDLNLGLSTSYNAFLSSNIFRTLADSDNLLAYYLFKTHEYSFRENNWVDIEHELKNFSNIISDYSNYYENPFVEKLVHSFESAYPTPPKTFLETSFNEQFVKKEVRSEQELDRLFKNAQTNLKKWFVELKQALCEYLQSVVNNHSKEFSQKDAYKLLLYGQLFNENNDYCGYNPIQTAVKDYFTQIFTFNYTNSLDLVDYPVDKERLIKDTLIYFMHGSLKNNDIVFGVEDGSVDDRFLFLTKSSHAAFGKAPDIAVALLNANEIHIFGCSLGDTDNAHFQYPFTELSKRRNLEHKTKIIFYVFGKSGYQNTMNRVLFLTSGRMSEFKITNDVIFFDLESQQVIDQQWINNQ